MHEMALAEGVLQVIENAARAGRFGRVKSVWLEIGPMAGVEAEALRFCFDAVIRNTIADGASLHIAATEGRGWCLQCSDNVPVAAMYEPCPRCGSYQVQVTGGTEMRVKELEVE